MDDLLTAFVFFAAAIAAALAPPNPFSASNSQ
jgi:hypothetical protein